MRIKLLVLLSLTLSFNRSFAGEKEAVAALDKGDYDTAYKEFLPLAEQGDAKAINQIGLFYHQGQGVKQDYAKAMDWYLKAFKKRDGDACNNIGVMYRDGLGVEKNLQIAYALFWVTYWGGLGDDNTQIRNGRNLDKTAARMKPDEIEEAVKMTAEYIIAYVEKRGKLDEKEKDLKFSKTGHPIKQLAEPAASEGPSETHHFISELRVPKNRSLDPLTSIELVTDTGSGGTRLKFTKPATNGNFVVLKYSTLLFPENRYAMIVHPEKEASQVFRLPLPAKLEPADWTEWKRPDYIETSDASWTFMHDLKTGERFTNLPPDCFELRYKIDGSSDP